MSLSVQERSLVCIYFSGTREATIAQMREALPHIDEPDVLAAVRNTFRKLENMGGAEFAALLSLEVMT